VRPYLACVAVSFRRQTTYRGAALAGLATNFFFGVLRVYLFLAVFRAAGTERIAGYAPPDTVAYAAMTQALIAPLYVWGWWEVATLVRTGDIAVHLARPVDFFAMALAADLGRAAYQVLVRGLPLFVLFPLIFEAPAAGHPVGWALTAASVTLAVMLSFAWRFLVNISAIWMHDALGVARMAYIVMTFLSGMLVPLAWFPEWLRALALVTPLPAMVNTPVEVHLGLLSGGAALQALLVQAAWFGVLAAAGRALFERGRSSLVIQGG
jgi:ABC-2 type transport system permease protein